MREKRSGRTTGAPEVSVAERHQELIAKIAAGVLNRTSLGPYERDPGQPHTENDSTWFLEHLHARIGDEIRRRGSYQGKREARAFETLILEHLDAAFPSTRGKNARDRKEILEYFKARYQAYFDFLASRFTAHEKE